ncbi:hypothetical protein NP233_g10963 [Leucocoprinus birnbaumii]|uniref:Protein kinase domain-containing protein n=1 Tax=Leucocoprinus birnbaumii TaxID=56174 RepID=A0AAD5VI86_9AGAR|nr:hypothetical protein NP233_g10963 [Leucocoprinus birnbaumii]
MWIQSSWFVLGYGCTSIAVFGRLGYGLVGYLSRWLLLYLWNVGLIRVQALRHDAKSRLGLVTSAFLDRVPIDFFGLTLGLSSFFDPWITQDLLLWKLTLWKVAIWDESSAEPSSSTRPEHSLGEVDHADYGTCDKSEEAYTEYHSEHATVRNEDTTFALSNSYASSLTLCSLSTEGVSSKSTTGAASYFDFAELEGVVTSESGGEQLYDPLSLFDLNESFMKGLRIDQAIGVGTFGAVYRGYNNYGRLYALKIMKN